MFCGNCGSNLNDDVMVCPKCGKSKYITENVTNENGYLLTKLTAKLFKVFFEISLWLVLILGFIIGSFIGNISNNAFGGMVVGGIISFVVVIISGGLVSILINMNNNIEDLKNKNK
jgi:hypothetical protein